MKKLRGHKPCCRCVACCPATRRRGMAALKRGSKRRHKNVRFRIDPRKWQVAESFVSQSDAKHYAKVIQRRGVNSIVQLEGSRWTVFIRRGLKNSLPAALRRELDAIKKSPGKTKKFLKILRGIGKSNGWKWPKHSRRPNPVSRYSIGKNATLYPGGYFKGSNLWTSGNPSEIILRGSGKWPKVGTRVKRIDYDNRPKAMRSYGRPGRFKHVFKAYPEVTRVVTSKGGGWQATLRSPSNIWKRG